MSASQKPEFKIAHRPVGEAYAPLVIAEIGINHGGDLSVAKQIADNAIDHGAEVVKHQTHIVEDEMSSHAKQVVPGNSKDSIYKIMQECALGESDERELKRHVESRGAIFISTPFSRAAANRLQSFGVEAYKIGSGECNNYPLIKHIAQFGKPIILSTGMNSIETVRPAVEILRAARVPFALLHTTNIYPTDPALVRLEAIVELKQSFPDALVGLSDHTTTNYPCLGAVALGASILERHFTDSKSRIGPDISCSMDGPEMAALIEGARIIQLARAGRKGAVAQEAPTIAFAFASVVTIKPIKRGEVLSLDNLWVKRPGTGEFLAKDFEGLLGRKVGRDLDADVQLRRADLA